MAKRCAFIISASAAVLALGACATTGGRAPASVAAAAPNPLANPAFKAADIFGRDAPALDKIFGAPALVRREGVGEFRRYALAGCALIVILYPDEAGALGAAHLDAAAKTSQEEKPDLDLCLARGLAAPSS